MTTPEPAATLASATSCRVADKPSFRSCRWGGRVSIPYQRDRGMPRLAAALVAVRRGWPVLPLHPYRKYPAIVGWEARASLDVDQVHRWWASAAYNVGIACGPAGLVVLDLDAPHDPADVDARHGREVLAALAAQAGEPDPDHTYTVTTPRGGEHRYFLAPTGHLLRNTAGHLGPHVDTRAAGGYVVAAGSVARLHRHLRPYRVRRDLPVAPLPGWLLHAVTPPPPTPAAPLPVDRQHLAAYVRAALRGEAHAVTNAPTGTRNHTLFVAAARLGELVAAGALDHATATTTLLHAAQPHIGTDGFTTGEAHRTITNGLTTGHRTPRPTHSAPDSEHPCG